MTSTYSVIFPNCGIHTKGEIDGEKFAHLQVENIIISSFISSQLFVRPLTL